MLAIYRAGTQPAAAALARIAARLDALEGAGDAAGRRRSKALFGQALAPRQVVDKIIADVRKRGDRALFAYARKLDGARLTPKTVRVSRSEMAAAHKDCARDRALLAAIRTAAANIRRFQKRLLPRDVPLENAGGLQTGARFVPLARVGVMIPAGTCPLFSSVLHNAIPAQVAGVKEIALASPPRRDGTLDPTLLAAAHEIGITEYYRVGGAQAVAALAYGTASVPAVDMIVGPGNIFVTLAKRAVFGQVQIDLLAGPSEVLVLADGSADAEYIAADLLAQAEHDPLAAAILLSTSAPLAKRVKAALERRLKSLPRESVAAKSIKNYGLALVVRSLREAAALANRIAPEHIELLVKNPRALLPQIHNAGAVFLGASTPEPIGDYIAGPSHTLPTGGTARAFSGLSSATFIRRMSVIACGPAALKRLRAPTVRMARAEQLEAHARSIEARFEENRP